MIYLWSIYQAVYAFEDEFCIKNDEFRIQNDEWKALWSVFHWKSMNFVLIIIDCATDVCSDLVHVLQGGVSRRRSGACCGDTRYFKGWSWSILYKTTMNFVLKMMNERCSEARRLDRQARFTLHFWWKASDRSGNFVLTNDRPAGGSWPRWPTWARACPAGLYSKARISDQKRWILYQNDGVWMALLSEW